MSAKLILKTITPVHIGKGNTITSFEYHTQNGNFYRFDISKAFNFIISEHPDAINKIDDWVEGKIDAVGNVGKPKESYKLNIFDFIKSLKNKDLETKFRDNLPNLSKYWIPTDENLSGKDVAELLKTANNEIYIPGSSIKGMIRNALLNDFIFNADENDKKNIIELIQKNLKKESNDRNKKHFADELEYFVFNCGYEKFNKQDNRKITDDSDAKFDMMKFIKVSDTNTLKVAEDCTITKPKLVTRKGNIQDQTNFLECIAPNKEFTARLEIDIDYIKFIAEKYPNLTENGNKIWVGFDKKFEKVFGINVDELRKSNKKEIEEILLNKIYFAIENFSVGVSNAEFKISNLMEKAVNIDDLYYNKINKIFDDGESKPFKLGWGGGFPATTIFTNFKDDGGLSSYKKEFEEVMNKFKIGQTPGKNNQNKPYNASLDNFPSSRKYIIDGKIAQAYGWIELKII